MTALSGTERRAQQAFERHVLGHVVALGGADGSAPIETVEQAIGYYRHAAAGNPAQQALARRLRAAVAALYEQALLDSAAPPETYRPTAAGRDLVEHNRQTWWRRALAAMRPR